MSVNEHEMKIINEAFVGKGMYECFHCGARAVIWNGDYDFGDYGEEEEGIIHECHCENYGAEITYRIRISDEDNEGEK